MPRSHDRALLDALEALEPETFSGEVWRVTGRRRDPLRGSAAPGRWTPPRAFEVLNTSLEREGALAEISYRLSLEPTWPSHAEHDLHRIAAATRRTPRFANVAALVPFGVEAARYGSFGYAATHFLEHDALIAPSARSPALHAVIVLEHIGEGGALTVLDTEPVDWAAWRSRR